MNKQELIDLSLERLQKFLGREVSEKDLDIGYDSLGADSMDMVVLAFDLEQHLGKPIAPEIFLEHETLRAALEDVIAR
ncbi:acyl carrier protein [Amylibacter sp. SFDW26]|uniref:acyl carrier protein n=1 Tax=Amylibacter sp. SFDW26 TaxID=2652722 RepID=UPI0012617D43|nr:acyl carrier protein [Amylibacter sp. SFDW26]KAB7615947.1 acyl carrier protein [Amylibacter sp. SFDW26]